MGNVTVSFKRNPFTSSFTTTFSDGTPNKPGLFGRNIQQSNLRQQFFIERGLSVSDARVGTGLGSMMGSRSKQNVILTQERNNQNAAARTPTPAPPPPSRAPAPPPNILSERPVARRSVGRRQIRRVGNASRSTIAGGALGSPSSPSIGNKQLLGA